MSTVSLRAWTDENTGREVRQLTQGPGASLGYFRLPKHLPGGWMLGRRQKENILLNPDSGEVRPLAHGVGAYLKLRAADGRLWTYEPAHRRVWAQDLAPEAENEGASGGEATAVAELPPEAELPGRPADITCDGRTLLLLDLHQDLQAYPPPTRKDAAMFWNYVARPRHGRMLAYDLATGKTAVLAEAQGYLPFHTDTHPTDPTLVRFAYDRWEGDHQRVWSIRTDGTELKMIRPQEPGELITHEFWWPRPPGEPDAHLVGFTYQDRRNDAAHRDLPWCEYAPVETRLGIADLDGRQVYLSDPVNHYHTHLYVSHDGTRVSGSGTEGRSFVHAARFNWDSPRVDLRPLATVHTPYTPFQGQKVNCDFSADGKWLLFNDTVPDGTLQVCAVGVE